MTRTILRRSSRFSRICKAGCSSNPGYGKNCKVDHPPVVLPREVFRTLRRHELYHSRPRLLVNLMTNIFHPGKSEACYENITCMALTAPHEADIEESLSNVTELGKFCTITCTNISTSVFFKPQVLVNSQWGCFPLSLFEGCLNALRNT